MNHNSLNLLDAGDLFWLQFAAEQMYKEGRWSDAIHSRLYDLSRAVLRLRIAVEEAAEITKLDKK